MRNNRLIIQNHPCPRFLALQIRFYRREGKLTQKKLAEISGVKLRHLQKIESGTVDLKLSTLGAISRGVGVSPDTLLRPVKENIKLMCEACRRNKKLLVSGSGNV